MKAGKDSMGEARRDETGAQNDTSRVAELGLDRERTAGSVAQPTNDGLRRRLQAQVAK